MANTKNLLKNVRRVLLYGPSGTGKTTLASTFPNPIFVDLDDGMLSLEGQDITYYTITENPSQDPDLIDLIGERLAKGKDGFSKSAECIEKLCNTLGSNDTLVIDSITFLNDYALNSVLKSENQKKPRIQDWGAAQKLVEGIVSEINFAACNIVVIAHEQFIKDEESGFVSWLPMTIGKLATKLPIYFDEVYHCYVERGKGKARDEMIYGIETSPSRRTTAKSRSHLTGNIEYPTYEKLYKK